MRDKIAFIRLPILLLVLFFIGKLVMGAAGVSYAATNRVFAMLPLAIHLSIAWSAFARRYGYGLGGGVVIAILIALTAQILILLGTAGSYLVGATTPFNNPQALGAKEAVPFGVAMMARAGGLFFNSLSGAVFGLIGWGLGALIPARRSDDSTVRAQSVKMAPANQ